MSSEYRTVRSDCFFFFYFNDFERSMMLPCCPRFVSPSVVGSEDVTGRIWSMTGFVDDSFSFPSHKKLLSRCQTQRPPPPRCEWASDLCDSVHSWFSVVQKAYIPFHHILPLPQLKRIPASLYWYHQRMQMVFDEWDLGVGMASTNTKAKLQALIVSMLY